MSFVFDSHSAEQTQALAAAIAKQLEPGAVIGLVGQLGAGKTSFVQGLARALGVPPTEEVVSPTYTLVNVYPAADDLTVVHIDFYRLDSEESAIAVGIEEEIGRGDAVTVVEWADILPAMLPASAIWLRFTWVDALTRRIAVENLTRPKGL